MKRIIALILALASLIALPAAVRAESGDATYTVVKKVFDYNFEPSTDSETAAKNGYFPYKDDGTTPFYTYIDLTDDETFGSLWGNHGSALIPPNDGSDAYDLTRNNYINDSLILHFEADWFIGSLSTEDMLLLNLRGKDHHYAINITPDGKVTSKTAANGSTAYEITGATLTVPGWNHFDLYADYINHTVRLGVNGTYRDGIPLSNPSPMRVRVYLKNAADKKVYLDNVKTDVIVPNYKAEAEYADGKIKLAFSEAMDDSTMVESNFKLTNALGISVPFTGAYSATDKTYTVTPTKALRPKTEHTLTATGLKTAYGGYAHYTGTAPETPAAVPFTAKFTTAKQPFAIESVTDKGAGVYEVAVSNTSGESKTGYIVAATYTSGTEGSISYSKIASVDVKAVSSGEDGASEPVSVTVNGESPSFCLMTDDGLFQIIDIWGK